MPIHPAIHPAGRRPRGLLFGAGGGAGGSGAGLRLPGTAGNYISSPDSVLNSVTGDIDIRAYIKPDDWTPVGSQTAISKWASTGNQRSYQFGIDAGGHIFLQVTADGTNANIQTYTSSVLGAVDGTALWVRATLDVDNGAGGHDGKLFTSADGITWTQVGASTLSQVMAIFDGTAPVEVGSITAGGANNFAGTIYYAEIRNGIDGPIVAKFDSSQVAVSGSQLPATINGWTWNGAALYKRDDYVRLPGLGTDKLTYPDVANVYGDLDLRIKLSVDNTAGTYSLLSKSFIAGQISWRWRYVNNTIEFGPYFDGTNLGASLASPAAGVVAGVPIWLRSTRVMATGLTQWFTSPDGVTWTTLGTSGAASAGTPLFDGNSVLELGSRFSTVEPLAGNVYYAEVRNGIGGPVVASFDARVASTPWTINGSGWNWEGASFSGKPGVALSLPGTNGNYASTPDTASTSIVADIDLRAKIAYDNWIPGANTTILGKRVATGNQRSYRMEVNTSGGVILVLSQDGTTETTATSTVLTGLANAAVKWVRSTWRASDGRVQFFLSDDGAAWTQLGADRTIGLASIFDSTAPIEIGSTNLGVNNIWPGKIYYAEVRNGIDGPIVAKFDATNIAKTGTRTPASTVQPGGTPNMLTPNQASIETDASGWASNAGSPTLAQDATQFLDGTKSLSITATAVGPATMSASSTPITVSPVVAGKLYTARINFKTAVTVRTVQTQIDWFTAASGYISTSGGTGVSDAAGSWTEATCTGLAPATAAYARVTAAILGVVITEVHYVDRISLVEAAEVWTLNGSAWDWTYVGTPGP